MVRCLKNPWTAVALWIAVIYFTIPFVRRLREGFVAHLPGELIGYGVMAIIVGAAFLAAVAIRRNRLRVAAADFLWLAGVSTVLVLWTSRLMNQPEEAVHFLEYGVLGVLLYRALRSHVQDATVFLAAALIGIVVGTVDEIIQWLVPGRFWDFRDIVLNGGASILVQIAIWRLAPPQHVPVTRSSYRCILRLTAVEIALLMVCLAATPQRIHSMSTVIPRISALAASDDAMCEYGFIHRIKHGTVFRSRLSLEQLERHDRERASEVAARLDASRRANSGPRPIGSATADPFAYEARVHLFTRGRRLAQARAAPPGSELRREMMTAAFRENLILEKCFANTLKQSTFAWPARRREGIESSQDPEETYVSPVARHLITWISEGTLRALMASALMVLLLCDFHLGRPAPTQSGLPSPPRQE